MSVEITVSKGVQADGKALYPGKVHTVSNSAATTLIRKRVAKLCVKETDRKEINEKDTKKPKGFEIKNPFKKDKK